MKAAAILRQSIRNLRLSAPTYSIDSSGLKEECSQWKELGIAIATCVRDLESENYELSQQVARIRQSANTIVGSPTWPVTLRKFLMMRLTEASFEQSTQINDQIPCFSKTRNLNPIPVIALDVTLSPNQANQLRYFLPSGAAYRRSLYHGIYIHTCTKCYKPRFRLSKINCYPLFSELNEYPKLHDVLYFGEVCSSCGLETLLQAIWRGWWHNLGNIEWLKHDWDQSCCSTPITNVSTLISVLDSLGCQDVNDVDDYVKKYPLPALSNVCKAHYHRFRKATKYRQALQRLHLRPSPTELDAAVDLHAHLIKRGRMRNFFDTPANLQIGQDGVEPKFDPGPIIVSDIGHDNLKVPIFLSLFRRQRTPKACIVCTEVKHEVDFGTLNQWKEDCAEHIGLWMWSILEYPNSAIQCCSHDFDVCRACTARHISTSLENRDVDRITCPQCNRVLHYEEVRNLGSAETFERSLWTTVKLDSYETSLTSVADTIRSSFGGLFPRSLISAGAYRQHVKMANYMRTSTHHLQSCCVTSAASECASDTSDHGIWA